MSGRIFILCACLLPCLGPADRVTKDNCDDKSGIIRPDRDEAFDAVLTELNSSENVSEYKSSGADLQSDPESAGSTVASVGNALLCKSGVCWGCSGCAECVGNSDTCAWISEVETYPYHRLHYETKESLETEMQDVDTTANQKNPLKGYCKKRTDFPKNEDKPRYIVVTDVLEGRTAYSESERNKDQRMIVLTGGYAKCEALTSVYEKETEAYKVQIQEYIDKAVKNQEIKEQREKDERERIEKRNEDMKTGEVSIDDLYEHCNPKVKKQLPPRYFVRSNFLRAAARFDSKLNRYGNEFDEWEHVEKLKAPKGDFFDNVTLVVVQKKNTKHLVVNDGRHRICATGDQQTKDRKAILVEVRVSCGDEIEGTLLSAQDECARVQREHDVQARQKKKDQEEADRIKRERNRNRNQIGSGGMYTPPGMGKFQ